MASREQRAFDSIRVSVENLESYIEELQDELSSAEATIQEKDSLIKDLYNQIAELESQKAQ